MVIKYVLVYYFMAPVGALNVPSDSRRFFRMTHSGTLFLQIRVFDLVTIEWLQHVNAVLFSQSEEAEKYVAISTQ